jgi:hypothetical protein
LSTEKIKAPARYRGLETKTPLSGRFICSWRKRSPTTINSTSIIKEN